MQVSKYHNQNKNVMTEQLEGLSGRGGCCLDSVTVLLSWRSGSKEAAALQVGVGNRGGEAERGSTMKDGERDMTGDGEAVSLFGDVAARAR